MAKVTDNQAERRYELAIDGAVAFAAYERRGDVVAFVHTEVPEAMEGHGVGSRLIAGALGDIRARGLKASPECSFVEHYVAGHPETADLLAGR